MVVSVSSADEESMDQLEPYLNKKRNRRRRGRKNAFKVQGGMMSEMNESPSHLRMSKGHANAQ
jgi:hypothetical protein